MLPATDPAATSAPREGVTYICGGAPSMPAPPARAALRALTQSHIRSVTTPRRLRVREHAEDRRPRAVPRVRTPHSVQEAHEAKCVRADKHAD